MPQPVAANVRREHAPAVQTTTDGVGRDHPVGFNRWITPAGTTAAITLYFLCVLPLGPDFSRLAIWASFFLFGLVLMPTFGWMPTWFRELSRSGVSRGSELGHLLVGINWGLALFVDVPSSRDLGFRWITLAVIFAVSAGSVGGTSSLNGLGARILYPMLLGTALGLTAVRDFAVALGVLMFLFILSTDLEDSRARWSELSRLRLAASASADKSAWIAAHDSLTGLLNRSGAKAELSTWDKHVTTAMFVDLDHFKFVNDRFGHAAGDIVLAEVAQRLQRVLRAEDLIARIGGDEFFIVLHGDLPDAEVDSLADRLIAELEQPITLDGSDEALISASVGIGSVDHEPFDPELLMSQADKAMYVAKRRGRRRAQRFADDIDAELSKRAKLESALRRDVRNGKLEAYAQPVFCIETGKICFVELLARWQTDEGENVSPDVFIPLAEEIGLIGEVTALLLEKAGDALKTWQHDPVLSQAKVSVNVSPVQVAQGDMLETVVAALERHSIQPQQVVVELTESSMLPEISRSAELFEALSDLGVELALDDFGAGYSSLGQLLSLPVTVVKIDKSLTSEIEADNTNQVQILAAIRSLATALGREVVVEGVEDMEQLDLLRALGIDLAQGFGLCPPVKVGELAEAIQFVDGIAGHVTRPGLSA